MGMKSRRSSSSSANPSTQRPWRLLHLALLWAQKGRGVSKCRLLISELRLIPKHIKSLKPHHTTTNHLPYYGERQLSFDETPVLHMRMSRPGSLRFMIPGCMKPDHHMFDYDFGVDEESTCLYGNNDIDKEICGVVEEEEEGQREEGIDEKAEEFINKFYKEMKLQRQISYLKYTDHMISRGATL